MRPIAQRRNYTNVFNALRRIVIGEGVGVLYSGLAPNVFRGMSMNAGMLACYDQAKQMIGDHITHDSSNSMTNQLGASAIAGFCAAFFSLPFDMLKSRLRKPAL